MFMTKYIYLFFSISLASFSFAQEITVEKIWKNYQFFPSYGPTINTMSDGISCVEIGEDFSIVKYKIANLGKGLDEVNVETLFTPPAGFRYDSYEFNSDESKILFLTNVTKKYILIQIEDNKFVMKVLIIYGIF